MAKPKRVKCELVLSCKSKASQKIARVLYDQKQEQIVDAVEYCKLNKCRGKKALSTGKFPLVKDHKTITRRLDGDVVHDHEKSHVSILLPEKRAWFGMQLIKHEPCSLSIEML